MTTIKSELQAKVAELNSKLTDPNIDDATFSAFQTELTETLKKLRSVNQSKIVNLKSITDSIAENEFSILDVFSKDALIKTITSYENALALFSDVAITQEAMNRGIYNPVAIEHKKEKKETKTREKIVFKSDENPVLIYIKKSPEDHFRVEDVYIHQGRCEETYQKTNKMYGSVSIPLFRMKADKLETIIENLNNHIHENSVEYSKTDKGKAEIKKIAEFLLNYVPPKKKEK